MVLAFRARSARAAPEKLDQRQQKPDQPPRSPEASLECPASIIPLSKYAILVDALVRIESEHARVDRVICVNNATIKVQCDERVLDVTASSDVRGAAEIIEHCDDPFCAADTHAIATIIALLIDIVACATW